MVSTFLALFNLVAITQSNISLEKHDKILAFFWGSWCSECKEKMATVLPEIERQGKAKVITLSMDKDLEKIDYVIRTKNITLPVYLDKDRNLTKKLKVFAVPHWAVFKANGENWDLVRTESGFSEAKVAEALK